MNLNYDLRRPLNNFVPSRIFTKWTKIYYFHARLSEIIPRNFVGLSSFFFTKLRRRRTKLDNSRADDNSKVPARKRKKRKKRKIAVRGEKKKNTHDGRTASEFQQVSAVYRRNEKIYVTTRRNTVTGCREEKTRFSSLASISLVGRSIATQRNESFQLRYGNFECRPMCQLFENAQLNYAGTRVRCEKNRRWWLPRVQSGSLYCCTSRKHSLTQSPRGRDRWRRRRAPQSK